jgi:hypothetical protein
MASHRTKLVIGIFVVVRIAIGEGDITGEYEGATR